MKILATDIKDLFILKPKIFKDDRGYFMESFPAKFFKNRFPGINFIQDNESFSSKGTLRGLHFQSGNFSQTKLVKVVLGEILDVAVDLRKDSKTFGKHKSFLLSESNKHQLLIPRNFAHGFIVLSEFAIVQYKVDNFYNPEYDSGIIYNDKDLNINWIISESEIKVSEKDKKLKSFNDIKKQL